jgi:hypothetical protein
VVAEPDDTSRGREARERAGAPAPGPGGRRGGLPPGLPPGGSLRVVDPVGLPSAPPGFLDGLTGALLRFLFGT